MEVIEEEVVAQIVMGPKKMLEVAQKAGRSMSKMQGTVKNLLSTGDIDSESDKTLPSQATKPDRSNPDHNSND